MWVTLFVRLPGGRGGRDDAQLQLSDLNTILQEVAHEVNAAHVIVGLASDLKGDDEYLKVFKAVIDRVKRPLVIVRGARD